MKWKSSGDRNKATPECCRKTLSEEKKGNRKQMKCCFRLVHASVLFIQVAVFSGCFPSDMGAGFIDTEQTHAETGIDRLYSEADSDLVLSIPAGLSIEDEEVAVIYQYAKETPRCRKTNGEPIPVMLAEACFLYDAYYLFPDDLPDSLDAFDNVKNYVAFMKQSDPFTFYYSPDTFSEYKLFREGDSAHIGFRYGFNGEVISEQTPFLIEEVYPFTRAWMDGLQAGDRVISVNGTFISGLPPEQAIDLFPDREGSTAVILVQRDNQEVSISTAAEEHIAVLLAPGTAYLSVRSFTLNTGDEVKKDFRNLQESSAEPIVNIILDLRDNPGGSNTGALQLTDFLIDRDAPAGTHPIMILDGTYYRNAAQYLGNYDPENIGDFSEASFVVLVDESSASAAEIAAAALKFYDEATVMGMQTYGKGVSQFVFELVDGSGIWVTAHYVYPPDRISFHQVGVSPDIVVGDRPTSFSQDPLLEKALVFLQTGEVSAGGPIRQQPGRTELKNKEAEPLEERWIRRGKFWK
ncbi:MAG: S41 family peptidase [Pseudomonadota bacterium]